MLHNVSGRPVTSNCVTPTENLSQFMDHHLEPIMKGKVPYFKDTGEF